MSDAPLNGPSKWISTTSPADDEVKIAVHARYKAAYGPVWDALRTFAELYTLDTGNPIPDIKPWDEVPEPVRDAFCHGAMPSVFAMGEIQKVLSR